MSCCWQERTRGQISSVIGDLPLRAVSITPVRRWHESPGRVFGRADAATVVLLTATLSTFTSQNTFRPSGWGQKRFPASLWLNCISIHWSWSVLIPVAPWLNLCGGWFDGRQVVDVSLELRPAAQRALAARWWLFHPELRGSNGFYSTLWLLGGSLNSRSNTSVMMLLSVSLRWVTPHRKSSAPPALLRIKHWSFSWCRYDLHV